MQKLKNSIKFTKQIIMINSLLFSLFLIWNFCQPLTADDYLFTFLDVIHNNSLWKTISLNYFNWTGRSSAVFLVDVLLGASYLVYTLPLINILNSIIAVLTLNLIYKLIWGSEYKPVKLWVVCVLYIAAYTAIGTFSQDFLWKTVAIQYLYGFCLLLFIFWRFYLNLNSKATTSFVSLFFYCIAGIFIGFYNEIYVALVCGVYLSAIIIWYIYKKPWAQLIQTRYIIFLTAVLISGVISIMAPGNTVRRTTYLSQIHDTHYNIITKFLMTYVQFFRYGYHVVIGVILFYVSIWTYKNRKIIPQGTLEYISFLLILLNIHILSFVGIAYYSPIAGRMLLLMDSIIFILLYKFFCIRFQLLYIVRPSIKPLNGATRVIKYCFFGFSIILFTYISLSYYKLHQFILQREYFIDIKYNSNHNDTNFVLPQLDLNMILKYPVYFDTMRTHDKEFINLYLKTKLN
jgi:hypothetical protein